MRAITRPVPPRLEALEDRLTPSATFDPATGTLFLRADAANSSDVVRVSAAGAANDGRTGVTVTSNLVAGVTRTFGDAAHPVRNVSLDLKNGNDTVRIGDLAKVDVRVGEGDGNNSVTVGRTAALAIISGAGLNRVTVGDAGNNRLGLYDPTGYGSFHEAATFVVIGREYAFGDSGGYFDLGDGHGPVNRSANVVSLLAGGSAPSVVKIFGTGGNVVRVGDGRSADVRILGGHARGNNAVVVGDGPNSRVSIGGDGCNSITVGGGVNGSATVEGDGNNVIRMSGGRATATVVGDGNNRVVIGDGDRCTVEVTGDGNNVVTMGDGDYDRFVTGHVWSSPGDDKYFPLYKGYGNNTVTIGDGDHVSVDATGSGRNVFVIGDGDYASIAFDATSYGGRDTNAALPSNGTGNNRFVMGDGRGNSLALKNSDGNNVVVMGDGDGGKVLVTTDDDRWQVKQGNLTVRMGGGDGDSVKVISDHVNTRITVGDGDNVSVVIDGSGGGNDHFVRVGGGANASVKTLGGSGAFTAIVGRGRGASIDTYAGSWLVGIDARANKGARIRAGGVCGYVAAAMGSDLAVNGVRLATNAPYDGEFQNLMVHLF